jgi:hypothetical protein
VSVIETVKPIGDIEMIIEYNDGRPKEVRTMKNTVLKAGRIALAKSLANDVGNTYDFYVARMLFGSCPSPFCRPSTPTRRRRLFSHR